jgi:hypothetical protein
LRSDRVIRKLAVVFGAMTLLTALGSMTPTGQAMLGLKPAVNSAPIKVIDDVPVEAVPPQHVGGGQPRPAATIAPPRPSPFLRRAATRPSPTAQPAQRGLAQLSNVARILLNLPQVLDGGRVGGAPGHGRRDESQPSPFNRHHGSENGSQDSEGGH